MQHQELKSINQWLDNIRTTHSANQSELDGMENIDERADRLTELSVEAQVMNLSKTSVVQKAWKDWQQPVLHGWVYRLSDGILKPICIKQPEPGN